MKQQTEQKLAIVLFIFWILTLVPEVNSLLVELTGFTNYGYSRDESFSHLIFFLFNLFYSAGNLACGGWLFYSAKKEGGAQWVWLLLGVVYGLPAIALYFLRQLGRQHKQKRFLETLFAVAIIVALGSRLSNWLVTVPGFPSVEFHTYQLLYYSVTLMARRYLFVLVNLGLAVWVYTITKQHFKAGWTWFLFTLFSGVIAPMIYFAYIAYHHGYIDVFVDRIAFGRDLSRDAHRYTSLRNYDATDLTVPLGCLKQISIHTGTYDFHQVERFLTYAVNSIGREHLKRNVDVHIYGAPDKLHPNLRNNLTDLCKSMMFHNKDDVCSDT